jgi:hypothetical protein
LEQQTAMMNIQDPRVNHHALPDNVVPFPRANRARSTSFVAALPRKQPVTGAELNARLLVLLGICTTSAAIALSAVHILQG